MGIVNHPDWDLSEKGKKDASRHRKKIDEQIRRGVKDAISEESIITKKKGKKVRIPVKGLKDYRFVHGNEKGGNGGAGTGDGKPGDVIGRKKKPGQGNGPKPGKDKGEDWMEVEVDIDYLIKIMFEDLGLPWIEEKTKKETIVPKGWKFESISKVGTYARIEKKKTMKETLMRTMMFVGEIMDETGCDEDTARRILSYTKGDLEEAISLLKNNDPIVSSLGKSVSGDEIFIEDDDMRYKQIEEDIEYHSKAVVIAMMDTSGSMDLDKKYLARSMLFWMVEFLKKCYESVEIRFITHTTEAKLVDEDEFFKRGESGGTRCASAFELGNHLIETEYPVEEWNVYCMYMSDGEDWKPDETVKEMKKMLDKKINMLGYCEITPEDSQFPGWHNVHNLLKLIEKAFAFSKIERNGTVFLKGKTSRFLATIIKKREHVWEALKHFLFDPESKKK